MIATMISIRNSSTIVPNVVITPSAYRSGCSVAEISSPYLLTGGVTAWSGASVGVTVTDDPRADVDRLLAQADRALYAAKGDGGNRYVVHPRSAGLTSPGPNLSLAAGGS